MTNHELHVLIPVLTLLSACSGASHGHDSPTINSGSNPLYEIEPNDNVESADYLGQIRAGDHIAIEGHIQECCDGAYSCCTDMYDGFALYATEPVSVHITLTEYTPGTDLDFAIYLPSINEVVEAFETDNHPEVGVFNLGGVGEFHIVINSWIGDADYILDIDVQPLLGASPGAGVPELGHAQASQRTRARFLGYHGAAGRTIEALPTRVLELGATSESSGVLEAR